MFVEKVHSLSDGSLRVFGLEVSLKVMGGWFGGETGEAWWVGHFQALEAD